MSRPKNVFRKFISVQILVPQPARRKSPGKRRGTSGDCYSGSLERVLAPNGVVPQCFPKIRPRLSFWCTDMPVDPTGCRSRGRLQGLAPIRSTLVWPGQGHQGVTGADVPSWRLWLGTRSRGPVMMAPVPDAFDERMHARPARTSPSTDECEGWVDRVVVSKRIRDGARHPHQPRGFSENSP